MKKNSSVLESQYSLPCTRATMISGMNFSFWNQHKYSTWINSDDGDNNDNRNDFDPSKLRLSQDFTASTAIQRVISTIPVRKPLKHDWVRVHRDQSYSLEGGVFETKDGQQETYLVAPSLHIDLSNEITPKVLFTAINRQGVLFLWPVRLPDPDGRIDSWNESAAIAAKMAKEGWVRVASNRSLAAYEISKPVADFPEPEWPDLTFEQILKIAFRDRFISSLDHIVLRRLRGEI